MDSFFKKIKDLAGNTGRKRLIENAAVILIIGIIILIACSSLFGGNKKNEPGFREETADNRAPVAEKGDLSQDANDLEREMEKVLSQIEGAGEVTVMITYRAGKKIVPATDVKRSESVTDERDSSGGSRSIQESQYESIIIYSEGETGRRSPVIVQEINPEVLGVVVIASGAHDPQVRDNLFKAVMVLLDVPMNRVQVFSKSAGKR